MSRARIIASIFIVAILAGFGYWGYLNYLAPQPPQPTPTPASQAIDTGPELVSAEGSVAPARSANLSFSAPGLVKEVFFQKGDRVQADQVIAQLENQERLQTGITAARLELLSAQQALDKLYEKADLASAQAQNEVADARQALKDAQRLVDSLSYQASETDLEIAQASISLAEHLLKKAQKAYKRVKNKSESNPKRAALRLVVAAAQKQYDIAVQRLNYLEGEPDEVQVAKAEAALALAEANLQDAQDQYQQLIDGPDPDELTLAQTRLDNARAQLEAATAAYQDSNLRAPFSGTLISLDLEKGEYVTPGRDLVVLADVDDWQIETTDLSENDVALLQPEMAASITLEAFPDLEFEGVIHSIDYRGQEVRGDITYIVTLSFDPGEAPVRWGMTAFVDITIP
jgi:HlyD family secretion protein